MSVHCPRCQNENPDQARFCMHCSAPLTQTCPNCGASVSALARFCQQCGAAIKPPVTPAPARTPAPPTGRLQPSTLLQGRYRIVRKLGQGGMGAVYMAEDIRLAGKTWAVKEMSDAALTDPAERQQAVQAFQQEARMLAHLNHPNLPKVTDTFSEGGNLYLVMEFVEGETLEAHMGQVGGPLAESQVVGWAEQLCDVLDYLHNQRPAIIFRDLKPANIMIQPDGQIKLIDFGIARHFKPGKRTDTVAFGTAGYAPPEQYGKGQTDARSDIYALGAMLHHLLTGRDPTLTPFKFPPVRSLNPSVSPAVEQAIAAALDPDPDRRWQSASAFRKALRVPAAGEPINVLGRSPQPAGAARLSYPAAPVVAPKVFTTPKAKSWSGPTAARRKP